MTAESSPMPLFDAALALRAAGLSIVGAREKRFVGPTWKPFAKAVATDAQLGDMFMRPGVDQVAIVCGAVSGNLECLDFDSGGAAYAAWAEMVEEERPGLLARLAMERSPRGGRHVLYRVPDMAVPGSAKLAARPSPAGGGTDCLVETRGEGAYFVCSPSPGYAMIQGDLTAVPSITPDERAVLIRLAEALDEMPVAEERLFRPPGGRPPTRDAERPGDDFGRRGDMRELLARHGWTRVRTVGANEHWRRPGKDRGTSATVKRCGGVDVFYVFTTSTAFAAGKGYNPFQVYAFLEHGGDFPGAAAALRRQGYGGGAAASPAAAAAGNDDVDISGILRKGTIPELRFPRRILDVGGFIGDVMAYTLARAAVPNPVAALGGALALQAMLCGGRAAFHAEEETRSNSYIIVLSGSATGKNAPRKTNVEILARVADECARTEAEKRMVDAVIADSFASGQGIVTAVAAARSILFQVDEMDKLLAQLSADKDRAAREIERQLMQMYSSSTTVYHPDKQADKDSTAPPIECPNLCVFGTATPGVFYESLSLDSLRNGLVGRLIPLESNSKPRRLTLRDVHNRAGRAALPRSVVDTAWHWLRDDRDLYRQVRAVPYDPDVVDLLSEASEDIAYAAIDAATAEHGPECAEATIWGRFNENRNKLILLRACSDNPLAPRIDRETAQWGIDLAEYSCRLLCEAVRGHVAENLFHRQMLKALDVIKNKGRNDPDGWVWLRDIYKALKKTERETMEALRVLEGEESIELVADRRGPRQTFKARICYR